MASNRTPSRRGLRNFRGTIGRARTSDPNSATCQFFINRKDDPSLDYPKPDRHGYAAFGMVIQGMGVIDSIAALQVGSVPPYQNVPLRPVVIRKIRRVPAPPQSMSGPRYTS